MNAIPRRFTRTTASVTVFLTVIGLFVAAVAAQLVGLALFGVVAAGPVIETVGIAVLMMLGFGFVSGIVITLTRVRVPIHRPTSSNLVWAGVTTVVMLALLGTFLVVTPVLGVKASLNQVDVVAQSYPIVSLLLAIVAVLFIGPFEELAFRGAIQGLIRNVAGPRVGIGAAALVFGLFHALAAVGPGVIAYIAYTTALGVVLGYVYERTDNLVVVALAHGAYNAVIRIVTWASVTGLITV